jgi:hypothetical protein
MDLKIKSGDSKMYPSNGCYFCYFPIVAGFVFTLKFRIDTFTTYIAKRINHLQFVTKNWTQ